MKKSCIFIIFISLISLGLIYWASFLRYIPPEPLQISRETTYLTEVASSEGRLLWMQALNKKYMIEPEDNALIEFVKICGLSSISTDSAYIEEFCKNLKYPNPLATMPIFVTENLPVKNNQEQSLKFTFNKNFFEAIPWEKEDFPDLAQAIEDNTETFRLIKSAAEKKSCVWPYNEKIAILQETPPRSFKPTYPIRLFLVKGLNQLHENDLYAAWDTFLTGLKLSHAMLDSNQMLLTLYGIFIYKDTIDCITELINHKDIKPELLNEISNQLDQLTDISKAYNIFEFEYRIHPISTIITEFYNKNIDKFIFTDKNQRFFKLSAYIDLNIICRKLNQRADKFLQIFKIEDALKKISAIEKYKNKRRLKLETMIKSNKVAKYLDMIFFTLASNKSQAFSNFFYNAFQTIFLVDYSEYVYEFMVIQEKGRILRLATLIKIHQRKTGKLPETIEEIQVSDSAISQDSFSGKPFRFKVASESLLIYSIGRDLKDNDGETSSNIHNTDIPLKLRK